jgi:hypothetical protein
MEAATSERQRTWGRSDTGGRFARILVALLIVVESKFTHGAWLIIVHIPLLVWACRAVKRYYLYIRRKVMLRRGGTKPWPQLETPPQRKGVVSLPNLNQVSLAALRFAHSLSPDVTSIIVDVHPQSTAQVEGRWPTWGLDMPLTGRQSPYRSVVSLLFACLEETGRREPERGPAVVMPPEMVRARGWQHVLHHQTALIRKAVLFFRQDHHGEARVVIKVSYHVRV